jgi:ribosomal protein L24
MEGREMKLTTTDIVESINGPTEGEQGIVVDIYTDEDGLTLVDVEMNNDRKVVTFYPYEIRKIRNVS